MAKKTQFKQLGKLLQDGLSSRIGQSKTFYSKDKSSEAFDFLALIREWPSVIGPRLAQHTIPLKNTQRSLTILTDHPAYSEQLKFMEVQLLQKIKERFPSLQGSLKTLYFKTDSTYFQKQKAMADARSGKSEEHQERVEKTFHKYSPEYRKLKAEADLEFKDIESEEIKERLTSIYIQSRQGD